MKGYFKRNRKEYSKLKSEFGRTMVGKELQFYMIMLIVMNLGVFGYLYTIDYLFNETLAIGVLIFGVEATLYRLLYNKAFSDYCRYLDSTKEN